MNSYRVVINQFAIIAVVHIQYRVRAAVCATTERDVIVGRVQEATDQSRRCDDGRAAGHSVEIRRDRLERTTRRRRPTCGARPRKAIGHHRPQHQGLGACVLSVFVVYLYRGTSR